MAADTQLRQMGAQCFVKLQHWFAETVMNDADAAQRDGMPHSAADRFGEGFLGRESFCLKARLV